MRQCLTALGGTTAASGEWERIERVALTSLQEGPYRFRLLLEGPEASVLAAQLRDSGVVAAIESLLRGAATSSAADSSGPRSVPEPPAAPLRSFGDSPEEPSSQVLRLARRLRGADYSDRERRIRFAYRLGRLDGQLVAVAQDGGRVVQEPSEEVPRGERRTIFVALSGVPEAPFWTTDRALYFRLLKPEGQWVPGSISRGLSTQSEFEAYVFGVGRSILEL